MTNNIASLLLLGAILILAGCGADSSSSPLPTPSVMPTPSATRTPKPGGSFAPASSTPSMNAARFSATSALLLDGKVLIAGGVFEGPGVSGPGSVDIYDPASNSFAPAASLPTMNFSRVGAAAAAGFFPVKVPNEQILIAGGGTLDKSNALVALKSVDLYFWPSNSFATGSSLPEMNAARIGATATFLLLNHKVLVAGGLGAGLTPLDSIELWDLTTNKFAPAASLPKMGSPRAFATATSWPMTRC
jgi:hypothetical protein